MFIELTIKTCWIKKPTDTDGFCRPKGDVQIFKLCIVRSQIENRRYRGLNGTHEIIITLLFITWIGKQRIRLLFSIFCSVEVFDFVIFFRRTSFPTFLRTIGPTFFTTVSKKEKLINLLEILFQTCHVLFIICICSFRISVSTLSVAFSKISKIHM